MTKRLLAACLVVAALMAIPSAASATDLYSGSTKLTTGDEIVGTNLFGGGPRFEAGTPINCTKSQWVAQLNKSSEARTKSWSFSGTGAGGNCTSAAGDVHVTGTANSCWHWFSPTFWTLVNCGGSTVAFVIEFSALGSTCTYSISARNLVATGSPVTVRAGEEPVKITKMEGSGFCAPSYTIQWFEFGVTDTSGNPLTAK